MQILKQKNCEPLLHQDYAVSGTIIEDQFGKKYPLMSVSSTCQKNKDSFDQSGHQTKTSEEFLLVSEDLLDQSVYTQKTKD